MIIENVVIVYIFGLAIDTKTSFGVDKLQFNYAQVWDGPFKQLTLHRICLVNVVLHLINVCFFLLTNTRIFENE